MSITTVYAQTDDKLLLEAIKGLDEIDGVVTNTNSMLK